MANIAVILAGCGYLDGAEIREAVCTLVALEKHGVDVSIFAPDIQQRDVVNHLTGEPMDETRNVLVESARIARGQIEDVALLNPAEFDALIMPGGFGAAKNLADIAIHGTNGHVDDMIASTMKAFINDDKPVGAICIAPALAAKVLKDMGRTAHVTLGEEDPDGLIAGLGGEHQPCQTRGIVIDDANHLVTTPAYMSEAPLAEVAAGIDKLVETILNQVHHQQQAA